jgi:hypothetical protein
MTSHTLDFDKVRPETVIGHRRSKLVFWRSRSENNIIPAKGDFWKEHILTLVCGLRRELSETLIPPSVLVIRK